VSITPARLLDTRPGSSTIDGQFQGGGKIGPGGRLDLKVTGRGGVPDSATAVVLNVTATSPSDPTFLTIWPAGLTQPVASNLNPTPGQPPTPNLVNVGVGTGGMVSIFNLSGSVDVLADVTAYFVAENDKIQTLAIPGASMVPDQVAAITFSGPCAQLPVANSSFRTPIPLPQGSTITKVRFAYLDAGANTTLFTLFKSTLDPSNNTAIVGPTAANTGDGSVTVDVDPPVTVDAGQGIYARAVLDATSFVCGVEVTYKPAA
jgi:hypothetical protein